MGRDCCSVYMYWGQSLMCCWALAGSLWARLPKTSDTNCSKSKSDSVAAFVLFNQSTRVAV